MKSSKSEERFKVQFERLKPGQKRAKFEDVVRELWTQMDDLGHDLSNALLVAPKGTTSRQVALALNRIESERYSQSHKVSHDI